MAEDIVERLRRDALSRANGLGDPAGHAWEEEAADEITALRRRPTVARFNALQEECDGRLEAVKELQARADALEAGCAVMRGALQEISAPFICGNQDGIDHEAIARGFNRRQTVAKTALSTDGGKVMLERVERLEKALEPFADYEPAFRGHVSPQPIPKDYENAVIALAIKGDG